MKHTISLVITGVVIVVALIIVSTTGRKVPVIPADKLHAAAAGQEGCVACHGPDKQAPLKPDHPPKEQCLICHKAGRR